MQIYKKLCAKCEVMIVGAGANAVDFKRNPKNHMKSPRKRTVEDNQRFEESFERLLCKAMSKEEY